MSMKGGGSKRKKVRQQSRSEKLKLPGGTPSGQGSISNSKNRQRRTGRNVTCERLKPNANASTDLADGEKKDESLKVVKTVDSSKTGAPEKRSTKTIPEENSKKLVSISINKGSSSDSKNRLNRQRRKGRSVACERVKPNTTKVTIDLDDEDETRNSDSKKRNLGETAQQRQQSRKGDSEKQKKSGNSGDHGSAANNKNRQRRKGRTVTCERLKPNANISDEFADGEKNDESLKGAKPVKAVEPVKVVPRDKRPVPSETAPEESDSKKNIHKMVKVVAVGGDAKMEDKPQAPVEEKPQVDEIKSKSEPVKGIEELIKDLSRKKQQAIQNNEAKKKNSK